MQASQLSSALCSFALTSLALILATPGAAMAQTQSTSVYRNTDYRFEVIFPEAPMERDVSYETRDGANVTARQFYVERGTNPACGTTPTAVWWNSAAKIVSAGCRTC